MLSFIRVLIAATAAVGVLAAPIDDPVDIHLSRRSNTANSKGTNNGYYYQFWDDGASGSTTYTNKGSGEYSVQWSNPNDFTAGKGWQQAQPRNITFTGTMNVQGNFYLAVYTWSGQGENYILENYGTYNPCVKGKTVATINSDGSDYQVCLVDRGNNYLQNWSIRKNKRTSGTVTTANHYNAYAAHGLNHNPLSAAQYQIVSTEGFYDVDNNIRT
ncbi:hypothetical protein LTR78_000001 [Recurvomyces mirabilis]|uniref:endo-1,4-beta-xylanase n=1 Tax=Recurvomyces mirabilis TaxID=574656 RepID=A0AAE1C668_9PEZI|nr:hypothetical protein LTR78_000001 [Recurvomyces mirabilis]KAK5161658.1 hypothetical protein LTS14_000002 [Recurvomyces mirabilis]